MLAADRDAAPLKRLAADGVKTASMDEIAAELPDDLALPAGRQGGRAGVPGRGRPRLEGQARLDGDRSQHLAGRRWRGGSMPNSRARPRPSPTRRSRARGRPRSTARCRSWSAAPRRASTRIEPLLRHMASEVTHCGEAGSGQAVKILNNMILFQTGVALAEALTIARANGDRRQGAVRDADQGLGRFLRAAQPRHEGDAARACFPSGPSRPTTR